MSKVKNDILKHLNASVLTPKDTGGNRDFADLCCDVINNTKYTDSQVAALTNMSTSTIKRMRECVKPYSPNTRSVEKLLKAFGFTMRME